MRSLKSLKDLEVMKNNETPILYTVELQEIQKQEQFFVFRDDEYHLELRNVTELKMYITILD